MGAGQPLAKTSGEGSAIQSYILCQQHVGGESGEEKVG